MRKTKNALQEFSYFGDENFAIGSCALNLNIAKDDEIFHVINKDATLQRRLKY